MDREEERGTTMAIIHRPFPTRNSSTDQAIQELKQKLAYFERIYECSSEEMQADLTSGRRHDTAEIAEWMFWYNTLKHLKRTQHEQSAPME